MIQEHIKNAVSRSLEGGDFKNIFSYPQIKIKIILKYYPYLETVFLMCYTGETNEMRWLDLWCNQFTRSLVFDVDGAKRKDLFKP